MERDYIIDYLDTAIEQYESIGKDKDIPDMWEKVKESFENEDYDKGLYLMNIKKAVAKAAKDIKKNGALHIDTPHKKLHKKIEKAWTQFIDIYYGED